MELIKNKKNRSHLCGYLTDNRGQTSLVITFAIMFLLAAAVFFLTNTSFKNLQAGDYIGKSSKSFYAAESGLEIFMYEKYHGTPLFVTDTYVVGDVLVCGCIDNDGNLKTAVANGAAAVCNIGPAGSDCNAQNMYFNVEKITNAANNKIKSIGGYQNIERAVRMQW